MTLNEEIEFYKNKRTSKVIRIRMYTYLRLEKFVTENNMEFTNPTKAINYLIDIADPKEESKE